MPATSTAQHPSGRTITFTEADHEYVDDRGHRYMSATAVVKRFFAPFDAAAVAPGVAEKRGVGVEVILAEWEQAREYACSLGTRTHENCEAQLKGDALIHAPRDERERCVMTQAWCAVEYMLIEYECLATELIVWSPDLYVAGTLDALMRHRETGALLIVDWKTNEKITLLGYMGARGLGPASGLHDCDMAKYTLQLNLYRYLLFREGYTSPGAQVDMMIAHLRNDEFRCIPIAERRATVVEMLLETYVTAAPF